MMKMTWTEDEVKEWIDVDLKNVLDKFGISEDVIVSRDATEDPFCDPDAYVYTPGYTVTTDDLRENLPAGIQLRPMTAEEKIHAFEVQQGTDVRTAMRQDVKAILDYYPDSMTKQKKEVSDWIEQRLDKLEKDDPDALFDVTNYVHSNLTHLQKEKELAEWAKNHWDKMDREEEEYRSRHGWKTEAPTLSNHADADFCNIYGDEARDKLAENPWVSRDVISDPHPEEIRKELGQFCEYAADLLTNGDLTGRDEHAEEKSVSCDEKIASARARAALNTMRISEEKTTEKERAGKEEDKAI